MGWMLTPYRRYFNFSGRSRRKEYWMFMLLCVIVYAVALSFSGDDVGGVPIVGTAIYFFLLASFIPAIAVQVRRFHDQDRSGWFSLLVLVPYIGGLIVIIFMCFEGTLGPNRFGLDPNDPVGDQIIT